MVVEMKAKFASTCPKCNEKIKIGDDMLYDKDGQPNKKATHKNCGALTQEQDTIEINDVTYKVKDLETNSKGAKSIDDQVSKHIELESHTIAKMKIAQLRGVERACIEDGIEAGAKAGMIYNAVDRERSVMKDRIMSDRE